MAQTAAADLDVSLDFDEYDEEDIDNLPEADEDYIDDPDLEDEKRESMFQVPAIACLVSMINTLLLVPLTVYYNTTESEFISTP